MPLWLLKYNKFRFTEWLLRHINPLALFVKIEIPDLLDIALSNKVCTDKRAIEYKPTDLELVQYKFFMWIQPSKIFWIYQPLWKILAAIRNQIVEITRIYQLLCPHSAVWIV